MAETTKKTADASDGKELSAPVPTRRRGGLVQFYNDVIREMKKVTWPTGKETWLTTVMVFIMVSLTVVFFFFVDAVLNWGEMLLIGAR
ncbi:MAG: preprotein translocase subunit SecE [Alphaproteobacteria bacterium]|nr:preprotein translocase subunit SecE [Alphaproteobacteria bacterium]MDE2113005.1 preprotein translocase subunit SecE [Alphaproteobacteria bacterium]